MDERLLIGAFGALVGAAGYLIVGLVMERRAARKRARDAGRAVYFELRANQLEALTALEHGAYGELSRSTFDRLLPDLATWLAASQLEILVAAYMGHTGFARCATDAGLPDAVRRQVLRAIVDAHDAALGELRRQVFTPREIAWLSANAKAEQASRRAVEAQPSGRAG